MFSFLANRQLRQLCLPLLLTEFLWGMGTFFTLPATTMAAYMQSLGASKVLIGMIATAMGSLMVLPQIFSRSVVERFRHRKHGVITLHVGLLSAYFLIPLLDVLLRDRHPGQLMWLIIGILGLSQLIIGFVIPVWLDMVARLIPIGIRGTYFGVASGAFSLGGILGGMALIGMTNALGTNVFRGAFLTSGICFVLSMTAFACAPVPESAFAHAPEPSILIRLRKAASACHPRTNLGRFLLSNVLFTLALGITAFVTVYAGDAKGLGYPRAIFSYITQIEAVGGALAALVLGVLVDRRGPRRSWLAMMLLLPVALVLLPHGGHLAVLTLCALLCGAFITLWTVSGPAMLELSPDGDKSGFIAMVNLAAFPASALGPVLMGGIIEGYGYQVAFIIAAVIAGLALLPALGIRGRTGAHVPTTHPVAQEES